MTLYSLTVKIFSTILFQHFICISQSFLGAGIPQQKVFITQYLFHFEVWFKALLANKMLVRESLLY